jgi:cytochrome c-type biogenesis protein CcmH/NrfG
VLLADCYLKLGHIESARLGYTQALAIDPANDRAMVQLRQIEAMRADEKQLAGSKR